MDTIWYLLLTLLLLSIMVVIHELGHFLFAKLFKVTVLEFSIGMGPALFTTKKKNKKKKSPSGSLGETFRSDELEEKENLNNEADTVSDSGLCQEENDAISSDEIQKTAFSIRAFPVGGYVSMAGEDERSTDKNAFCNKPVWQRLIITVAGAVMNILLGIFCMCSLVGIEAIPTEANPHPLLATNVVSEFAEDSLSDKGEAPLMKGDRVIMVDGVLVHTGNELVYEIMNSGYEPIDLVIIRDGERITLKDVTFKTFESSGVTFGDMDFKVYGEDFSFVNVVKHAFFRSFSTIKVIIDSLKDLLTGRYGTEAVSGPIGMAGAVEDAARSGFTALLYLFTLITMNLGVFNLLPLPALDGGRIIFLLIEAVARRPIKKEIEGAINTVGLLVLLAFMLLVTMKDVISLF